MALCLSPQQRQNCLRLRNAHLHKVRDILQDRYRINDMMQSTLPSYDFELQAARQHLRALQVPFHIFPVHPQFLSFQSFSAQSVERGQL